MVAEHDRQPDTLFQINAANDCSPSVDRNIRLLGAHVGRYYTMQMLRVICVKIRNKNKKKERGPDEGIRASDNHRNSALVPLGKCSDGS
jgi:hypothetical protein